MYQRYSNRNVVITKCARLTLHAAAFGHSAQKPVDACITVSTPEKAYNSHSG